ncbi:MAG: isoleucine--tRNA ligase [Candidatus Aenigmarchaeota archaeon]|nr:isoleucine--tRNA ligase [Candidatus Aenigmarchaeota archaeon]
MIKEVKGHYNPKELEQRIREYWESNKIPTKLTKFDSKKKKFYLLDGPPYANADPHVGHVKTTTLKDIWSKFKLLQGFSSWFQPGFDMHGLPIENMVEKKLGIKAKQDIEMMGVEKFINECRKFATGNEQNWLEMYRKLGAWRGYIDPYITFENYYIESGWWTVKQMFEKGMLVPGEKSIYWCPHCETALAGYEVSDSYADVKDPSIYVKFPLVGKDNEYFVIWTTTPWTLISNVGIAVHPDEYYVKAKVGNEILIIAEKRVQPVLKELLNLDYEIVERIQGKKLEGIKYKPVFDVPVQRNLEKNQNAHRIILSIPVLTKKSYKHRLVESEETKEENVKEFVTMNEGSGLVHTAPGHGPEDHIMGLHYNLPVVSPVNEQGRYTEDTGEFKGVFVKDADKVIAEKLEKKNLLLNLGWIVHPYPLCWRCKSPLVFRVSKQWFFKVDEIKEKMIKENEKVRWLPEFGRERFHNWLEDATDWCISQQRYWGIPLPIWICQKCDDIDVIGSLDELKERSLKKLPKNIDLHKHAVDKIEIGCRNCKGSMKRVPDTMNVWFDSGIAPWASLGYPYKNKEIFDKLWPVDIIDESQDQIRGWFYSLMFCGVATFGQSPYKSVALNGWVLDEKSEKMSKSLGNVVWGNDALEKLGADILRLYYCWEVSPWEVQNFSFKTAEEIRRALNILWNSYSFFTTYVDSDFNPSLKNLKTEDKWILSKLNSLAKDVTNHMENFEFHNGGRKIISFVVNDLSRFYIKLIRDRVWVSETGDDKTTALSVLRECLLTVSKLLSPITPFLSEEIYLNLDGKKKSVMMIDWLKPKEFLIDNELESHMEIAKEIIEGSLSARQQAGIKLRRPVMEVFVQSENKDILDAVANVENVLLFMCNAKTVGVIDKIPKGDFAEAEFKQGKVFVNKSFDESLMEESLSREVIRQIQAMRKDNKFHVKESISLTLNSDEKTNKILKRYANQITKEVGAGQLSVGKTKGQFKDKIEFEGKSIEMAFDKN